MNKHTEILNRHSKELTGMSYERYFHDLKYTNAIVTRAMEEAGRQAMEEYKNQSTQKINLKELREKYIENLCPDYDSKIKFDTQLKSHFLRAFDFFVTELKLKEDSK